MVEKGCKYGLLVIVFGETKNRTVIVNHTGRWTTSKDPGEYDETIQAKDSSFDRSKGEKKHARKIIEH